MKFALAGNPNSGKTTLFNALTGSSAHVGNWPGVTVDKREGVYKKLTQKATVVDLPGIYSLSPYTPEELVARQFIIDDRPDAIIDIVDATNLVRNLYLTTQFLETDIPCVVALNMADVLQRDGVTIDTATLSRVLGVPVVEISALKSHGIDKLMKEAEAALEAPRGDINIFAGTEYEEFFAEAQALASKECDTNVVFHAVKSIEGDEEEKKQYPRLCEDVAALAVEKGFAECDFEAVVADLRYKFIEKELGGVQKREGGIPAVTKSDKIDRVLTHKIWGLPIFLFIMLAVFHFTFSDNLLYLGWLIPETDTPNFANAIFGNGTINSPGVILFNLVDQGTSALTTLIYNAMPAGTWYTSLVVDGLCGGLFSVISFIPQIMVLFLFLSLLEDSGYMARIAFILDRALRRFGLSGRAFMPLLMCFGCAVPGIMATRTLGNEKERRMTIILAPFFSCGAKLPIWAAFGAVLFKGAYSDLIVYGLYLLGIVVAVLSAIILKKTALKGEMPPFLMEMPAYHMPQARNTAIHLWDKLKHYLFKAGTVIAGAVVVIWFLTNFGFDFWHGMVEDQSKSIIGMISGWLAWLFVPLGFGMGADGWKFVVAAFTGLIAKEMVVASLGTFAGVQGAVDMAPGELVGTSLGALITSMAGGAPAALAFMAFNLLCPPCMSAVAAANSELKSAKKMWFAIGYWMLTAYVVAALIFWVGTYWWLSLVLAGVIGAAAAVYFIVKKVRRTKGDKQNV